MKVSDENKYRESFEYWTRLSSAAGYIVAAINLGKLLQAIGDSSVYDSLPFGVDEHSVLILLEQHGAKKPMDLVSASLMPPAKITRALDKLEKIGALTRHRDDNDRRSITLELTDNGRSLIETANENLTAAGARLGIAVGEQTIAYLNEVTQKIALFLAKWGFDDESPLTEGEALNTILGTGRPARKERGGLESFFFEMAERYNSLLHPNLNATILFELDEAPFHLLIAHGTCHPFVGGVEEATLTIRASADLWLRIATGELDGGQALMDGQYQVEGNLGLHMQLPRLFSPNGPEDTP